MDFYTIHGTCNIKMNCISVFSLFIFVTQHFLKPEWSLHIVWHCQSVCKNNVPTSVASSQQQPPFSTSFNASAYPFVLKIPHSVQRR